MSDARLSIDLAPLFPVDPSSPDVWYYRLNCPHGTVLYIASQEFRRDAAISPDMLITARLLAKQRVTFGCECGKHIAERYKPPYPGHAS